MDDKVENVLTARSFGVRGIIFDDADNVIRQLKNLCEDPIQRAWSFLRTNKKQLPSVTSNGVTLSEVCNKPKVLVHAILAHITLFVWIEFRAIADSGSDRRQFARRFRQAS